MSSLHSIPFRHAIHFLACITLVKFSSCPILTEIETSPSKLQQSFTPGKIYQNLYSCPVVLYVDRQTEGKK